MNIKTLLAAILIIFSMFGCDNDNDSDPIDTTQTPEYFPFTVGNYWVYDIYSVNDTSGLEELKNFRDTVKIIAEEIINGNNYYVIEQKEFWLANNNIKDTIYLRDSSGYIVNLEGVITFSDEDFNTILHSVDYSPATWAVEFSVSDTTENLTVPAGTFECLNYKGRVYSTNPSDSTPDRFQHHCYAEDVGLVFETIFFANPNAHYIYERRLSEYHLE